MYFSLIIEGKGKRDEHISQIIFTRCLRLTLRMSKMPKNFGGLHRPPNPQLTCSPGFANLGREHKKISDFFLFLVDMPVISITKKAIIQTTQSTMFFIQGSYAVIKVITKKNSNFMAIKNRRFLTKSIKSHKFSGFLFLSGLQLKTPLFVITHGTDNLSQF